MCFEVDVRGVILDANPSAYIQSVRRNGIPATEPEIRRASLETAYRVAMLSAMAHFDVCGGLTSIRLVGVPVDAAAYPDVSER